MQNLIKYKDIDPDRIYYKFPEGSLTFFYVPNSGNLYIKPYPTSHQDMLIDDDDMFEDVYGDLEWNSKERKEWSSRGVVLSKTNTIMGRLGAVGDNFVLSFWNDPTEYLNGFLNKLYKKFPALSEQKNKTIVVAPIGSTNYKKPYLLSGGGIEDQASSKTNPEDVKKKFVIAGRTFSIEDIRKLRASLHMGHDTTVTAVLCHPDLNKYPELAGYRPSYCGNIQTQTRDNHPSNWRQAAKKHNLYAYGENFSFKDFFNAS